MSSTMPERVRPFATEEGPADRPLHTFGKEASCGPTALGR